MVPGSVNKGTTSIEEKDLPVSLCRKGRVLSQPSADAEAYLDEDLSVKRLDDVDAYLWLAGRPLLPRPLNNQLVLGRTIVPTTDASLHLVWTANKMFLKPLPRYMLASTFYDCYLQGPHLSATALGLLCTYVALLPTELDFALAKDAHLLPHDCNWEDWRRLTTQFLTQYPGDDVFQHLPKRYRYGELRLGRLNKIYRLTGRDWLHGYSRLTGTTRYVDFLAENLGLIAAATVYIVVVLTAMQVGLATDRLKENKDFQRACYGFGVFAILAPIIALAILVTVLLVMVFANWWRTVNNNEAQSGHRNGKSSVV